MLKALPIALVVALIAGCATPTELTDSDFNITRLQLDTPVAKAYEQYQHGTRTCDVGYQECIVTPQKVICDVYLRSASGGKHPMVSAIVEMNEENAGTSVAIKVRPVFDRSGKTRKIYASMIEGKKPESC